MREAGRRFGKRDTVSSSPKGLLGLTPVTFFTTGLALYSVVRGMFWGFEENELLFLLAIVTGLLGMEAFNSALERRSQSRPLRRQLAEMSKRQEESATTLVDALERFDQMQLSINGLRLGAGAGQLLLTEFDIPRDRMQRARQIQWSGITLRTRLRQRLPDLGIALAHGARLDLLAMDPSSADLRAELAVRESSKPQYVEGVMQSMVLNLQLLSEKAVGNPSLKLGFHQVFPTYGLIVLDPQDADGICLVELYNPDLNREAVFVVHATLDASWFKFFVEQFAIMQSKCRTRVVRSPQEVDDFAFESVPGDPDSTPPEPENTVNSG